MKAPRPEQQRFQGAYEQAVQTFYQVSQKRTRANQRRLELGIVPDPSTIIAADVKVIEPIALG